jgi:hypothetical protein
MARLIAAAVVCLLLAGCATAPRERVGIPRLTKPSSAEIPAEQLSEAELDFCRRARMPEPGKAGGRSLCRKFLLNRNRLEQSNEWIVTLHQRWPR